MNIQKSVQSPSIAERTWFGLNKQAADAQVAIADAAVKNSDLLLAQQSLLEALKLHPGLEYIYRRLGLLLSDLGLTRAAEQCFRGQLPDFVNVEWFSDHYTSVTPVTVSHATSPDVNSLPAQTVQRHICHEPVKRDLRPPLGISPPTDPMFRQKSMTSSIALVDHAPKGSLWFDGFNRVMLDGSGKMIEQHTRGNASLIKAIGATVQPRRVEGRAFFVGNRGYNNYYHWMLDILPSIDLFRSAGFVIGPEDYIVVFNASSSFQKRTLEDLGFRSEQIIQLNRFSPYITADELIVPFYMNGMAMTMGEWVPAFLQRTYLGGNLHSGVDDDHVAAEARPRPHVVPATTEHETPLRNLYLARAPDARNGRAIANEPELIEFLEKRDFTIVFPEKYSIAEQARIFSQADTIVASHGAGLTNIAFCSPGTTIIELYGDFMATCYWAMSEVCQLRYINHYCSSEELAAGLDKRSQKNLHELRQLGFSVNLKELDTLLDHFHQA